MWNGSESNITVSLVIIRQKLTHWCPLNIITCNPSWCRRCLQLWPPPTFPSCIFSGIHLSTFVSVYFLLISSADSISWLDNALSCIKFHSWLFSVTFLTELCPGDVLQNETFCILKIYGASIYTVTTYKVNTTRAVPVSVDTGTMRTN